MNADGQDFTGHEDRECGEHRTVGPHRAWCHDCSQWCYPSDPCPGCELPLLRHDAARLSRLLWDARETIAMWADLAPARAAQDLRGQIAEIDAYRAEKGWNPDGFGGEDGR